MRDADPLIAQVPFGSAAYHGMLDLRDTVLRRPLGLVLTPADTEGEAEQIHIAAFDGAVVVGTIILKAVGSRLKMRQVAVAAQRQGTGLGATLVRFAEALANEQGATAIELHAREEVAGFYVKLGYQIEGEPFVEVGLAHVGMIKHLIL